MTDAKMKQAAFGILFCMVMLLGLSPVTAQVIWSENFTYPNGTMTGANNNTANPAADWVSLCPTCVAGDWYEVQANILEGHDTNGAASMETEVIDISAFPAGVEVTMVLSEAGDLEGCPGGVSTGCNSIDWIQVQYSINGGAYVDVGSPAGGPCAGACAGDTYYTYGDFNTVNVRICPLIGNSLRLKVSVQTWAAGEYLRVDDIVVQGQTCSPAMVVDSIHDVTCNGFNDGFIWVSGSGGLPPFQYSINGGAFGSASQFNNLPAGTYTITQSDANGALVTISGIVVGAGAVVSFTDSLVHVSCNGLNDGQAFGLNPSGGQAPYQFALDGSAFSAANGFSNLSAGAHQMVVQDQAGCRDTIPFVITEPTAISLSGSSTVSACTTATGTATVTATGGTPGYSYSWNTSPVQSNATATGLFAGTYSVVVTDDNGCLDTLDISVGQASQPVVVASGGDTICVGGGPVQLSAAGGSGVSPYQYSWTCSGTSCPLDSLSDDDPLASPTSTTVFYVQANDAQGCVSSLDSVSIVVIQPPLANAGNDTSICAGSVVTLQGSASGNAPYTYNWVCAFLGTCPLDSLTDDDPTATLSSPMTFLLQVTDRFGCSSAMDSVRVQILATPVADAGIGDSICPGDTAQLSGSASGAGPVYGFNWTPNTDIINASTSNPQVFPLNSTWYYLEVSSNGCTGALDSVWIEVEYAPVVDAGRDTILCLGDALQLIGTVNGTSSNYSLEWTGPGGLLNPLGNDTVNISPTQTADYVLVAYPAAGCASLPDSIHVEVELPFVHPAPSAPQACLGEPVQIGVEPQTGFSYHWSPITGLDHFDVASTFIIADSLREFTLTITDSTKRAVNCRVQEFEVILAPSSCIFPNAVTPNGDGINDALVLGNYHHPVQLSIFDRWGNLVYHSNQYQNDWEGTNQAGEPLPEGVYFYTVRANILPSNSTQYSLNDYNQAYNVTLLR